MTASLLGLAPKYMLWVRNHTVVLGCHCESAHSAGSLKARKTATTHSEKWNHPPASNSPGLIFDTWTLFSTQLPLGPQISFDYQHFITLFMFTLYTSAKVTRAAFLNIQSSRILCEWVNGLLALHDWGYRVPFYPCYRPTEDAEMGQMVSKECWTGRCGHSLLPSWVCFSLQKVLDI